MFLHTRFFLAIVEVQYGLDPGAGLVTMWVGNKRTPHGALWPTRMKTLFGYLNIN